MVGYEIFDEMGRMKSRTVVDDVRRIRAEVASQIFAFYPCERNACEWVVGVAVLGEGPSSVSVPRVFETKAHAAGYANDLNSHLGYNAVTVMAIFDDVKRRAREDQDADDGIVTLRVDALQLDVLVEAIDEFRVEDDHGVTSILRAGQAEVAVLYDQPVAGMRA